MYRKFFLLISFIFLLIGCSQKDIIELPITEHIGAGPFYIGLGGISPDPENDNGSWKNCRQQVTGIPESWTDAHKGSIQTNIYQMIYQNYIQRNITDESYTHLQESWNWDPDTLNLSKEPLKCQIAFAVGKDSTGESMIVIDANNNLDFSDDTPFKPAEPDPTERYINDSLIISNAIEVSYERLFHNKIVTSKAPLTVVNFKQFDMLMSCFPMYATANLNGTEIAISANNLDDPSFKRSSIIVLNDSLKNGKKADHSSLIHENEYVKIDGKIYMNLGVDRNKDVLKLKKIDTTPDKLYSSQIGFKAFPFSGENIITKDSLSLEKMKGKYVYLDFWSVYCGPCIQDLPNLKTLHDKLDTTKFEYMGILCSSPGDAIQIIVEKYGIDWPLVVSESSNNIEKQYGVNGYPTTFLIDPDGVIIAKDLRSKSLEEKIKELSETL